MLRELIQKEVAAVKHVVHDVKERIHPTVVMKEHEFDRPLDDLGQNVDDVERRAEPQEPPPTVKPPTA